ncbi:MAG: carbamoyl phosphate synthase [Candidatus Cloacimonadota bacterium]|nr:MAG: carbamoyl phosphate synthase [Candidatus Cloacimonadota bacterium]
MEKISVLVTGASGGGVGEQILKALKLSSLNLFIITTDVKVNSKGLSEGDKQYIVPFANDEKYIPFIVDLCEQNNVKILFPGSEAELTKLSQNREVFAKKNIIVPINSNKVIDICVDKTKTMTFLKDNGFNFPKNITVKSSDDISKIDFLPAVIKPSVGGGGSKDIMIAQTKEEVELFSKYLLTMYDEFIVQEYVGTPDSEYTVGILSSMDEKFINSIAIHKSIENALNNRIRIKNRTDRLDLGKNLVISSGISEGYVDKFPMITLECEKIAKKLGARAALNIQCRFYNDKVYIFEINPRYSGTTSIRALMGYNEPEVMIKKYILKENIEVGFGFQKGYVARGLTEVVIKESNLNDGK